ncbi:ATP-binding protein [Paenibacillus polymyxa]|uniref:sensor histidine kinase n=1 Tax=Paenibacillus polymyxa TaxID=1406 RepID=UPI0004D3F63C|nr:ATP-binding protein [Paenibacillus polymyxa]KEO77113.1 histidine kinase [Paenibacillus polymyxa]MCH6189032.1 ATP-binding protein [Paenibacillus polymyxa]WRL57857.1 ATP-binding protein [Paenibacillus polymyxa]
MKKVIFDFILNSFDLITISGLLNKVLVVRSISRTTKNLILTFIVLCVVLLNNNFLNMNSIVVPNIILIVTVLFFYYDSLKKKFWWGLNVILIGIVSHGLSFVIIKICFPDLLFITKHSSYYYEMQVMLSEVIKFFIFLWIPFIYRVDDYRKRNTSKCLDVFLISLPIVTLIMLGSHCELILKSDERPNPFLSLISVMGVLSINIAMQWTLEKLNKAYGEMMEQELVNLNNAKKNNYYDNLEKSQKEIRVTRHNMKNELLTLQGLLKDQRNKEADAFIKEILSDIRNTVTQKYTPNYVLNYLLTEKISLATEKNVLVTIDCFLPEKFSLSNNVIANVFGNLLDNAIEACDKITEGEKSIDIKIKYHERQLYLEVSNSYNPKFLNSSLVTKKKDRRNHGFGLKSVRKIVKENSGIIDIRIEEHKFYVNIVLWDL